jgi:hypothetical protein
MIASPGNKTAEMTFGAPTIADAMIAAAQSIAFAMTYFRFMVTADREEYRNTEPLFRTICDKVR